MSERKGVHHAGDVTLRPAAPWSPAIHALLVHLDDAGFAYAPRVAGAGFAVDGKESVTFVPGEVDARRIWSDEGIHVLGKLLRELHQATASFQPPTDAVWQPSILRPSGPGAIFSHGDAAPWNVVTRTGLPVALIDWELAGPVDCMHELAHTGWLNARLFDDEIAKREGLPPAEQRARLLRSFADGYGLPAKERRSLGAQIIEVAILSGAADAIEAKITLESTKSLGLAWDVAWRVRSAAWLIRNRSLIESALR